MLRVLMFRVQEERPTDIPFRARTKRWIRFLKVQVTGVGLQEATRLDGRAVQGASLRH